MLGIHDQRDEMLQKAWRAQKEDALQEQGPGLPVRARSVRSRAAEGEDSTYAAEGCSSGSPAWPAGRRSRLDIRSWRLLLRKSGMPSRSMLGAKLKLMYNTCEAVPTESVSLLRTLH